MIPFGAACLHKIEVSGVDGNSWIPFGELVRVLSTFIYFGETLFCLRNRLRDELRRCTARNERG